MTPHHPPVERLAADLLAHYGIEYPPVPVEAILQNPARDMWREIDLSLLGAPLRGDDPAALRMSLAGLLARLLLGSAWGQARGGAGRDLNEREVQMLARAVLMPRSMLTVLPAGALTPLMIGRMFEAPRDEARRRLIELDVLTP